MISSIVSNDAVEIYSTLNTVNSLSLIMWNAINSSFISYLYENMGDPQKTDKLRTLSSGILAMFSVVAFLATMLAPEIVRILTTERYCEAIHTKLIGAILVLTVLCCLSCLLLYETTVLRYLILLAVAVAFLLKRETLVRLFKR